MSRALATCLGTWLRTALEGFALLLEGQSQGGWSETRGPELTYSCVGWEAVLFRLTLSGWNPGIQVSYTLGGVYFYFDHLVV